METPFKGVNYINESVLDREARRKEEKNNMLLNKRQHLMKRRELLGFPPRYPSLAKYEDYEDTCDSSSKNKGDMKAQGVSPCRDGTAKLHTKSMNSYRGNLFMAPPETTGHPIPMDQPYVRDSIIRAKLGASLENTDHQEKPYLKSAVFPQLETLNARLASEDEKRLQRYLFTTSYQAAYGKPVIFGNTTCRRIYPIRTLESIPDPVKFLAKENSYFPSTSSWMPEKFDPLQYDLKQTRYPYINEDRPYEVCSHYPRIDQIPGYSGSFTTNDRRVDSDNPYKEYKSVNLVRQKIPQEYNFDLSFNMSGYTGYQKKEMRSDGSRPEFQCPPSKVKAVTSKPTENHCEIVSNA
uniref:Uncharacterized protein n=1 Tax=Trichobilharzia regenti TaxID=157069 RepID=A0AA85JU14_TRIRE|nr:unnamed protein product [Trichobilharzia regenti]